MELITVKYQIKWRLTINHNYGVSKCGKMFNIKKGKEIKKTVKGLTPGYWIGRDFIPLEKLRSQIELIPKKQYCPF